jgi:hypothetical protein
MKLLLAILIVLPIFCLAASPVTIAVPDLECLKCDPDTVRAVSDILRTEFAAGGNVRVIERSQLDKVIAEQKLSYSELADEKTAVRFGKLLGAKYIAVGSVSQLGGRYTIALRILDVETAATVVGDTVSTDNASGLPGICQQLTKKLFEAAGRTDGGLALGGTVFFADRFENTMRQEWIVEGENSSVTPGNKGLTASRSRLSLPLADIPTSFALEVKFTIMRMVGEGGFSQMSVMGVPATVYTQPGMGRGNLDFYMLPRLLVRFNEQGEVKVAEVQGLQKPYGIKGKELAKRKGVAFGTPHILRLEKTDAGVMLYLDGVYLYRSADSTFGIFDGAQDNFSIRTWDEAVVSLSGVSVTALEGK